MTNFQNDLILVGATGRLGSSILKTNSISYGICSPENPLQGKKIDNLIYKIKNDNSFMTTLGNCVIKKVNNTVIVSKER